jgi:hypothetical protein
LWFKSNSPFQDNHAQVLIGAPDREFGADSSDALGACGDYKGTCGIWRNLKEGLASLQLHNTPCFGQLDTYAAIGIESHRGAILN